ncbi:MAG: hypothetical protein QNK42_15790 [Pseudodonghicola sp.]|nr:hypothetical protein [Pseudodonghicola sp.]
MDAYWLAKGEHKQFGNTGVKALALWAAKTGVSRVIFELTGIYHRCVETGLAQYAISFARVNQRQARRFCEGEQFEGSAPGALARRDKPRYQNPTRRLSL